ncbi:FHA domain-containing protein [Brevibacterium litoralis]|uniref:FHA domain-containing protein n=1 Tax=Brevibacterium litoralis TaxID=3138935 RepID=UPI003D9A17AE
MSQQHYPQNDPGAAQAPQTGNEEGAREAKPFPFSPWAPENAPQAPGTGQQGEQGAGETPQSGSAPQPWQQDAPQSGSAPQPWQQDAPQSGSAPQPWQQDAPQQAPQFDQGRQFGQGQFSEQGEARFDQAAPSDGNPQYGQGSAPQPWQQEAPQQQAPQAPQFGQTPQSPQFDQGQQYGQNPQFDQGQQYGHGSAPQPWQQESPQQAAPQQWPQPAPAPDQQSWQQDPNVWQQDPQAGQAPAQQWSDAQTPVTPAQPQPPVDVQGQPGGAPQGQPGSQGPLTTGDYVITDPRTGEVHAVPDLAQLQETDALLVVVSGPDAGAQILLDTDVVTVGRSPNADIFLDDVTVSRKHAEFVRTPTGFTLRDTGSLNGTYVGRQLIDSIDLQNGADVQIGKFRMIFQQRPRTS